MGTSGSHDSHGLYGSYDTPGQLRAQAEAWLAEMPAGDEAVPADGDLAYELRVARVERDLLGEALRAAQREAAPWRQRYADLFERSPVGLLTLTASGLVIEANVAAATLFGATRPQLLDRSCADFVAEADRESWRNHFAGLSADGAESVCELTLAGPGGAPGWRRVQVHSRRDQTDAGPTVRLTVIDISGRHATEDLLRKLSLAVEQSPESIVITNLAGEIEYVNDAFVRIAGYPRESLIGRNMSVLQSGKTDRAVYLDMWQTLAAGRPWKGKFVNRREDGSEYVESAIITPLRQPDGRITHYVAVKEIIRGKRRPAATARGRRPRRARAPVQ